MASVTIREYMSGIHILAAARFCRVSGEFETAHEGEVSGLLLREEQQYIIASITLSVAFIEASINELFQDIADEVPALRQKWEQDIMRFDVLKKFDTAIELLGKQKWNKGGKWYSDIKLLIKLRNELIHYRPTTRGAEEKGRRIRNEDKFPEILRGRFDVNPLAGDGTPFFPGTCLGYGCAKWSVDTSIRFVDKFSEHIGKPCPYPLLRDEMKTG